MTLSEIGTGLATLGLPVAYYQFNSEVQLPFIVYLSQGTNNFVADNKVAKVVEDVEIELYTEYKDTVSENLVEGWLDDNSFVWDKTESYIDTEKMFQISYSIRRI